MSTSTAPKPTDAIGTTHTVRITCDCRTCRGRAAWTTQAALDKGATEHGLVTLAFSALGKLQRAVIAEVAA